MPVIGISQKNRPTKHMQGRSHFSKKYDMDSSKPLKATIRFDRINRSATFL